MTDSCSTIPADDEDQSGQAPPGYPRPTPPPTDAPTQVMRATSPEPPTSPGSPIWSPPPPPAIPPPASAPSSGRPTWSPPPVPPPSPPASPAWPLAGPGGPASPSPWSPPVPGYPATGYQPAGSPPSGSPPSGYPPSAYPTGTGGPPVAPPLASAPAAPSRRSLDLKAVPPHLLASAAISLGVIVLFFSTLLIALGEPAGTAANIRLLEFLSPADLAVGALLVLAVALTTLTPAAKGSAGSPVVKAQPVKAEELRLLAGFVAVAVTAAALVRALFVLSISNEHVVLKLGNMIDGLAGVAVAAVAAFWALITK